ncbi:hypothetical protein VTH82DRAFT_5656 [Thermothelomyces myriococcoides]
MIFYSHGAGFSLSSVTVRSSFRRTKLRCRRSRRRYLSSLSRNLLYRSFMKMTPRKAVHYVWNVSRGIVFSGGSDVVYPRLPALRYYSATAAVASEGDSGSAPSAPAVADMAGRPSSRQGPEDMMNGLVTASSLSTTTTAIKATTTRTTTASASTTITASAAAAAAAAATVTTTVDGGSIVKDQTAVAGTVEKSNPDPKPEDSSTHDTVPFTPLDFKIPEEIYRAARRAPKGSPESFWNFNLYRGPSADGSHDAKVKIHYCTSMLTTERVIKQYFMKEKIVGFDLEWNGNALKSWGARRNVSLIQLASPSRIGLFHIANYPYGDKLVAPSLKKLMEDPSITKVGVWIKGDCRRLADHLGIQTQGQFELSHLYRLVKYSASGDYDSINKKLVSLATQVEECLGLPIFKGDEVRVSNWTKRLTLDQIMYSSSDAYAALQLFAVLNHQRQQLDPVPDLPHHAELNLPIPVARPAHHAAVKKKKKSGRSKSSIDQSKQDAAQTQEDSAKKQDAGDDAGGCSPVTVDAGEDLDNTYLSQQPSLSDALAPSEDPSRWDDPDTQSDADAERETSLSLQALAILTKQNDQPKHATTTG